MSDSAWEIDTLEKAYRKGYMHGLAGQQKHETPYDADVLIAAWEAGWDDGYEHYLVVAQEEGEPISSLTL